MNTIENGGEKLGNSVAALFSMLAKENSTAYSLCQLLVWMGECSGKYIDEWFAALYVMPTAGVDG